VIPRRETLASIAVLLVALGAGCKRKVTRPAPVASSSASEKPVDRLAPGELAAGEGHVFGFEVPAGMKVKGAFLEIAYLEGDVAPEALANYVRERVELQHVEIGVGRTLFPRARIKNGAPDRLYDLEVAPTRGRTELVIRDVTPRPKNPPGMTNEERWRQAGRSLDGKPLDLSEFR
jgi:hypothetical protein